MSLVIAFVAAVVTAVLVANLRRSSSGAARARRAREQGDVATARLMDIRWVSRDRRGGDKEVSRAKYSYEVDGIAYQCTVEGIPNPPKTLEICYDRSHGNRYIDPDGHSSKSDFLTLLPLIVFVVTLLLLGH